VHLVIARGIFNVASNCVHKILQYVHIPLRGMSNLHIDGSAAYISHYRHVLSTRP